MRLGIDASNLRQGGGQTHLRELLQAVTPKAYGFKKVVVWGEKTTLSQLKKRSWLLKRCPPDLSRGFISRAFWQNYRLPCEARRKDCDVLFVPGGTHGNGFHPVVTMNRNMLPFEMREIARYGISVTTARLLLLRWIQKKCLRKSEGVIFLTAYARNMVLKATGEIRGKCAIIPHGLNQRFFKAPKKQNAIREYHQKKPFKILYVSIIDQYKHQWNVLEAVWSLRQKTGWPVVVDFVGPAYPPALRRLRKALHQRDPHRKWAKYRGNVDFSHLPQVYHKADLGVFASSCENMPNILLEMMAAGLPIASSNRGPMPEILKDSGLAFDPLSPADISDILERLIQDPDLRTILAKKSHLAAQKYSWEDCANKTFCFLADMHKTWNKCRR